MKSSFFSYKGRISLKKYFFTTFLIFILGVFPPWVLLIIFYELPRAVDSGLLVLGFAPAAVIVSWFLIPYIVIAWVIFSFPTVKRLHDIGGSGWFYLLMLLNPVYILFLGVSSFLPMGISSFISVDFDLLYFIFALLHKINFSCISSIVLLTSLLILFLQKGTVGINKYGPDPLEERQFTPNN